MRDLNFFSEPLKAMKSSHRKRVTTILIFAAVVFIIGGAYAFTELTVYGLKTDIASMDKYLKSSDVIIKQKEIAEKQSRLAIMKKYSAAVDSISSDLDSSSILKSEKLEDINNTLPAGCFFTSFTYSNGKLGISGFSDSRVSIAELIHNLNASKIFKDVHLMTIGNADTASSSSRTVDFEISCTVKGGSEK